MINNDLKNLKITKKMNQSSSNSAKIKSTPYQLAGQREGPLKIPNSTIKNKKCADSGETVPERLRTLPTRTEDRMSSVDKYFNMFGAGGGKSKK